jgi:hypothetical protein
MSNGHQQLQLRALLVGFLQNVQVPSVQLFGWGDFRTITSAVQLFGWGDFRTTTSAVAVTITITITVAATFLRSSCCCKRFVNLAEFPRQWFAVPVLDIETVCNGRKRVSKTPVCKGRCGGGW